MIGTVAAVGYVAYVAAPKHPMRIQERVIDGHRTIDSDWSDLLGEKKAVTIDWRAQVNTDPAKPPFVILLRSVPGAWQEGKPKAAVFCDGRQISLKCSRAEIVAGEATGSSFLVCTGTLFDLAAIAGATETVLMINGRQFSFGSAGPGTFRDLRRRGDH